MPTSIAMEITGCEDTAKRPLTTALPENQTTEPKPWFSPQNEPKPTDLGQCQTVTSNNTSENGNFQPL